MARKKKTPSAPKPRNPEAVAMMRATRHAVHRDKSKYDRKARKKDKANFRKELV